MESSFSLKPQAFSLTTRAPVSWPLSTRPVSLLRSEFLGCGHNLRLPRRRCKKLRLQSQPYYYKFLFKATLESQQMLVVVAAFAAVSAITVVYFTYSRKQFNVKQMSGRLTLAVSQHIRSMMSWILTDSNRVDLRKIEAVDGSNDFMKETRESNQADKDMEAEIKFRETDVIPRGILIAEASQSQSDMVASCVHDNLASQTSEILEISSMASISSKYNVPSFIKEVSEHENPNSVDSEWLVPEIQINFGAAPPSENHIQEEMAQLGSLKLDEIREHENPNSADSEWSVPVMQANLGAVPSSVNHIQEETAQLGSLKLDKICEHENPNSVDSEWSVPVMQTNLGAAPSSANHIQEETAQLGSLKLELLEEGDMNYSNLIFRDSEREELHTINLASLEKLDNLEPLSSYANLQKNGNCSSLLNDSLAEGSNLTARNVILSIGKFEEERPPEYQRKGFLCQQQDSRNRKELRKKGKNIFGPDRHKNLSSSSYPKEKNDNDKHNPLWQLRVYNQLLREGRLNDCIELLEDLEEKGLLDMDKVYHVRFFDVCKNQKAVKEAFRFTKLIPNPTLSTFNMLMSVCASSQDSEGAFQVLQHVQEAGFRADCKLYTTLISTCAKSGKVDTMFKVFHDMVNAGVQPNVHTYGALIDGCAKAGQVAKAFGAYGILRSKDVKPDRVVFNALITACGQSGAVDRAFDVLAEMRAELQPIDPDHVTIGALMKACASADQVDRAREVYNMIHEYDIRGTAELYTIAVNSCSHHGDWEFACSVYDDMIKKGVAPDEMFISALIDVAGHAGKVDAAFEILQEARAKGMHVGTISYSSLMGACSKARDWQKAVELYESIKSLNLKPTVSMMNALITALCDSDQLQKAMEALSEMKGIGLCPNTITYSILLVASEKKDDLEAGLMLISQAKKDGVNPNLVMCRCLLAMCLRRFQAACTLGEPVLSFTFGQVQLNSKWTSLALMVYRETIVAGTAPTKDELSQVLGCLKLPHDVSVRNRLIENLGLNTDTSKGANLLSLIDGFGEYDPRAFSLLEEAASLGVIPFVSLKESPIVVDVRNFQVHTAEVYFLTVLKGLKHRLAAGAKLPNVHILLPIEKAQIQTSAGEKMINIASRISQAVAALLRRLGLSYQGNESYGKIRINGVIIRKWFQPKLGSPYREKKIDLSSSIRHLGSGISRQQRKIRTVHFSLE
ncbi:pentatricopeptide repeat-containing protein MRL1, chloroplastic [Sesamum indicum]|uniref:Pentatricopeptide repeat-containing protein MRL1, chloroplastic n=1 Tax=Sesamum indicum TaxID=4182 RepID=A0A8M8V5Q3_SESIN|nr:pentatricopeptide repeat-containing protein MRL1, chloroplastic [Sesamum indicum]XP_020551665.1 pentatricopeptide repeat-containing protein MRL1, chloroplastic [Sesamum indicum]